MLPVTSHHVGTKLNQAELHELEVLAAKRKQTQAELIRGLVLREIEQDQTGLRPSAEMVEITACRLLLVNLLGPLAKGQAITQEGFDGIVDEVKKQKSRVARDRLKDHAALRRGGRVPCALAADGIERERSGKKAAATGTSDLPFFRWRVYGAREASQGSALRSDRYAAQRMRP